jgi:hypothetical protein
MIDTKNPHSVTNVNAKQGPRTGNASAHAGKRREFQDAKAARAPLADEIARAYGDRAQRDYIDPRMEGISPVTAKKFKR